MKRTHFGLALSAAILSCVGTIRAADFYDLRFSAGQDAFRAGNYVLAADDFRIACFGFLRDPDKLEAGLAWLALTQSHLGRADRTEDAINRFLEVERRFSSFPKAPLDDATRLAFVALLRQRLPAETLAGLPEVARFIPSPEQRILALPPGERRDALRKMARQEPRQIRWPLDLAREAAAAGEWKEVVAWAGRALDIDPSREEARALRAHAHFARREWKDSLADLAALPAARLASEADLSGDLFVSEFELGRLSEARGALATLPSGVLSRPDVKSAAAALDLEAARTKAKAKEKAAQPPRKAAPPPSVAPPPPSSPAALPANGTERDLALVRVYVSNGNFAAAEAVARDLVKRAPGDRRAHLALLEAACLNKDWKTGAGEVARTRPFSDEEFISAFYAGVVLWETGDQKGARELLAGVRGKILLTPFARYYFDKALPH